MYALVKALFHMDIQYCSTLVHLYKGYTEKFPDRCIHFHFPKVLKMKENINHRTIGII